MIVTDTKELHKQSDPIHPEEYEDVFVKLEEEIKKHKNGIGLSAPQIGIMKRAFVFWGASGILEDETKVLQRVANPTIIDTHLPMLRSDEGCLSIPDVYCSLERFSEIEASDDIGGRYVLTGDDARVYQHETNHLDGILITDLGSVIPNRKIGRNNRKIGRNELCYCGSGKKFKKCHGK